MGVGRYYQCPKCGYELQADLGIGIMFPSVFKDFMMKAKKGELGKEFKDLADRYSNGALDVESVLAKCTVCGNYETVPDLTFYKRKIEPIPNDYGKWLSSVEEENGKYVVPWDLSENYEKVKQYLHRCSKCDGKMEILGEEELDHLTCPKCKTELTITEMSLWD